MPATLPMALPANFNPNRTIALPRGTTGDQVLAELQARFGAVKYSDQESFRYPYYYSASYPAAGVTELNFFGTAMGQSTAQITNIETPGSLGNYSFLLQAVNFDVWFSGASLINAYTVDTSAIYSDIVHGFCQAGVWQLTIGNLKWDEWDRPFLTLPPGNGRLRVEENAGLFAWSQGGGSPFPVTGLQSSYCFADLNTRWKCRRNLQYPIFIAPMQSFVAQLKYPSGLVPLIATGVITGSVTAYVKVTFDGWRYGGLG